MMTTKTAAVYARVSSQQQKEDQTIDSQVAALRSFAAEEGYVLPEEWIFRDEGYSGAVLRRPALEGLRDLAHQGHLEAVLVYAPDRLARKYAYQVLLVEELRRCGADVIFLKASRGDSPEDELLLQFQGMIAEYERAQIAERSRRGKTHRARSGDVAVLSGAPYGYRYVRKTDGRSAYYEIVESQAHVVREIFRLYTRENWSIGAITRHLSAEGILTQTGKTRWDRSTVWGMLRNPAYAGRAAFGKTQRMDRPKKAMRTKILALVLMYEIHDVGRFPTVQDFTSYCRLVKPSRTSAGKSYGTSGKKIGSAHLKWAFSEAAQLFLRGNEPAKTYFHRLESKYGKSKALSVLAHKLGRSIYYMLRRGEAFDVTTFLSRA